MFPLRAGGYEYDGREEIGPLQRDEIAAAVHDMAAHGVRSVVVAGVFSPANPQQEEEAGRLVAQELAKVPGVCVWRGGEGLLGSRGLCLCTARPGRWEATRCRAGMDAVTHAGSPRRGRPMPS